VSRENVDLVAAFTDAFNRRDWDAVLALVDPAVQVESRLVAMEGGYHGHEGLRRWWDDFLGAFPDYTVEVAELRVLGDVTLAHVRGQGHGAGSATPVIDPFWMPVRWRDGKIVWWRNCSTEEEALEAIEEHRLRRS
jgi:ketosteroid isomerase-like protein